MIAEKRVARILNGAIDCSSSMGALKLKLPEIVKQITAMSAASVDDEMVERVARAIAPRIFHQFDCDTVERAAKWEVHSEKDRDIMRLIAQDALAAVKLEGVGEP